MVTTLVTIGYHYGELEWGRAVKNMFDCKYGSVDSLEFYEVKSSSVFSGDICENSYREIMSELKKTGAKLWIDIHCGHNPGKACDDGIKLSYHSVNYPLLHSINHLGYDASVSDYNKIPFKTFPNRALLDFYLPLNDLETKSGSYYEGIVGTLDRIVDLHDVHKGFYLDSLVLKTG